MLRERKDGAIEMVCDDCAQIIWSLEMVQMPKGFPIPMAAMRPMISQAIAALAPEFDGCALLCPACAPIRKIHVNPSMN